MAKTISKPPTPVMEELAEDSALKREGFKQLTVEALEDLISRDPSEAQRYLDLFDKLKGYKADMVRQEGLIKTQIMILKAIQREAEYEYQKQKNCEAGGHMRQDNRTALVGQRDNFHEVLLVCQRCQKHYHGLGGEKGLPMHLVASLDMSLIGGVQ